MKHPSRTYERCTAQPASIHPDRRAHVRKANEFTRFVAWAAERLNYLEHCVGADGIAEELKSRELFPETDPLVDPPDELIEE
jgi:hypothetical protein